MSEQKYINVLAENARLRDERNHWVSELGAMHRENKALTAERDQLQQRVAELEEPQERYATPGWYVLYHPKLENRTPKAYYQTEKQLSEFYAQLEGNWRLYHVPSMTALPPAKDGE